MGVPDVQGDAQPDGKACLCGSPLAPDSVLYCAECKAIIERVRGLYSNSGPDQSKLHAEVNQTMNQRLTITLSALAIFGVIVGFIVPRDKEIIDDNEIALYLGSMVLNIILCGLWLLTIRFKEQVRIITSYLIATGQSMWEQDWKVYRDRHKYVGYAEPMRKIFLALCVFGTILPFLVIARLNGIHLDAVNAIQVLTAIVGISVIFIIYIVDRWFDPDLKERAIYRNWISILKEKGEREVKKP